MLLNLYWECTLHLERGSIFFLVVIESDMSLPLANFFALPVLPIGIGLCVDPNGW